MGMNFSTKRSVAVMNHRDVISTKSGPGNGNDISGRFGACHRCGWVTQLERITRAQRPALRVDRSCRWMCDDCVKDLSTNTVRTYVSPTIRIGTDYRQDRHSAA
jgi:hypothetical protein